MYASPRDFEATTQIETHLNELARRAKLDPGARNQLYEELEFKIARFVRRANRRVAGSAVCDAEDVAQEAFVVFWDLVDRWPGQVSFLGFFLSRFPWRLARAITVMRRGESSLRSDSFAPVMEFEQPLNSAGLMLLIDVGTGLDPDDRVLLELHIGQGVPLSEIAVLLQCHRRTVQRRWSRVLEHLRATWSGRQAPRRRRRRQRHPSTNRGDDM